MFGKGNLLLISLIFLIRSASVAAFTDYLLKTCVQSGFCNRNRLYAANIQAAHKAVDYYSIDKGSITYQEDESTKLYIFKANIWKTIKRPDIDDIKIQLPFTLSFFDDIESVRFIIDEQRTIAHKDRFPEYLALSRYNETWKWAFDVSDDSTILNNSPLIYEESSWGSSNLITIHNSDKTLKIELSTDLFKLKVYYKGKLSLTINDRSLFNLEHHRSKEENFQHLLPEESSFNMFGDDFEYSKDDTLIFGPESVALDFTFNEYSDVFGIPEHADSLRLTDTSESDPYRLFNADVFEYNINSRMPMYGAIPLMIATNPKSSVGVFWVNAADTWVDIKYNEVDTKTHWMSEAGIIDVVLFFGDIPSDITKDFITLTGKPQLPLLSAIGYHQCRWNYNDEQDILNVDSEMDRAHIPYDFIWLDLEYTNNRKYFTWKPDSFPNPKRLLAKLERLGRNLVVLIDPHLKKGYEVSEEVISNGVAVKNSKFDTYIGHCWPGKSVWIDTLSPLGQSVWDNFFKVFVNNFKNLHIWNDMNEPSIFDGPETTAPKDLLHFGGVEERSVHNIYGLTVHEATYKSLKNIKSDTDERPFLLTRSFFAGSQRTAATWTGDNAATWDYLRISIPMCLTNNIAGMPFIGADIAGFSGDPEPELLIRWYQAGLWYPFFRGHAHIDSKRREPFLLEEPVKSIVRETIRLRYALLPSLYTCFHDAHISGAPIMKPMFYEKPEYKKLYSVDDQFYIGDSGLLVKPIVEAGKTSIDMHFAPGIYYDYNTLTPLIISGKSVAEQTIGITLDKIPMFIEGGHIITKRDNYRRSSKLMHNDPYTLVIALGLDGNASGRIYIDDGETFAFERGEYKETAFNIQQGNSLISKVLHASSENNSFGNSKIEKIIIATSAMKKFFKDIATVRSLSGDSVVVVKLSDDGNFITISNPLVTVDSDWEIIF